VLAASPWIYALGWTALGFRLRLDGVAVAAASPSAAAFVGALLASAALFVVARSAWFARRARALAWGGLAVTSAMIVATVTHPPRSGVVSTGPTELIVAALSDDDATVQGADRGSVRWSDPSGDSRRSWPLGPFTLAPASRSESDKALMLRGPGLPPAGAPLPRCLTFADAGLRVTLYDDPARSRWFVVCNGSDSHGASTMLGERSAHAQPVIVLVHRFVLHRFGGRMVPSDPGLDVVRRVQRGTLALAAIGALAALGWVASRRKSESAGEHASALIVLGLATAPLVVTWAFVWSR
jgi:hypothetical protein